MIAYDALPRLHRLAGRYLVEGSLGHGRSSVVYKALDTETGTHVALKVLDPMVAADPIAAERFLREAQILRALDHPNIIKVYALLRDGDWRIISMEWFEGSNGKAYVERYGRLPVAEFLVIAKTVVSALEACHRSKVVHRDLKPHNILIDERRNVKIVDLGISKMNTMPDLTQTGTVFGTPEYLAPEQFQSSRADPRSDIYAHGATFYELLSGRPPFPAASLAAVMTHQLRGEIEPFASYRDDVPRWLEAVIFKCLRIDPARRYQSCCELRRDLEKGERAAVTYEGVAVACGVCHAELLSGLPFCPQCGTFRELMIERGRKCLILTRCDPTPALRTFVVAQFPDVPAPRLTAALAHPPAVLFRGISARAARDLMHQLGVFSCELQVADHVATAMQLPGAYAWLGIALLLPLFWMAPRVSVMTRVMVIGGAESILMGLYWWQSRAVIPLASLRRRNAAPVDAALAALADRLRQIGDPYLRMILSHLVRSSLALSARLRHSTAPIDADAVARAVRAAFDAARVVEHHELYLSGTSLHEIQARLQAVEAELSRPATLGESERLIQLKTKLSRDLQDYQAIQEAHGSTLLDVLNLQAVLHRMEDAFQDTQAAADIAAELRGIEDGLTAVGLHDDGHR